MIKAENMTLRLEIISSLVKLLHNLSPSVEHC